MRRLGPDVVSVVSPRGLTVGYILFRFSVVCTVESLSLFLSAFNILCDNTSIRQRNVM